MRLFLFECKKILFSKTNALILIAFSLLSIWTFNMNVKGDLPQQVERPYYNQGQLMGKKEVLEEVSLAKKEWTGKMDKSWWQRLEKAYLDNILRTNAQIYDNEKMIELYGEGWNLDYALNRDNYVPSNYAEGVNEGKRILIERETFLPSTKEDIASDVAWDIYMNYAENIMKNKPWNSESGTYGMMFSGLNGEAVPSPVYSSVSLSKAEILLLKQTMNNIDAFNYGDTKNLGALLNTLATTGILLMIWVILISTDIVNKERKQMMLEIQRTCTKGKNHLFISKLGAVLTCSMVGLLAIVGGVSLYALVTGGIGDLSVSVIESIYMVSIFTFGQAYVIGVLMMLLGVVVIATIGCLISTFMKSPYISLAITILAMFIIPGILDILGINNHLLPLNFMNLTNVSVRQFTVLFFGQPYLLWKLLPVIWLPISLVIIIITWFKYRSKAYQIV